MRLDEKSNLKNQKYQFPIFDATSRSRSIWLIEHSKMRVNTKDLSLFNSHFYSTERSGSISFRSASHFWYLKALIKNCFDYFYYLDLWLFINFYIQVRYIDFMHISHFIQLDKPSTLFIANTFPCSAMGTKCQNENSYCKSFYGMIRDRHHIRAICGQNDYLYDEILMNRCGNKFSSKEQIINQIRSFVRSAKPRWLFLNGHCV